MSWASNTSATSTGTIRVRWWLRLREAQQIKDGPVIVHALTTKGKGHPQAEKDYYRWHATGPFDLKTGQAIKSKASAPTYTAVFGNTLAELMEKDEKIIALTAAMPDGTGICTRAGKISRAIV